MSWDMYPDWVVEKLLDWKDAQVGGLVVGLLDSEEEFGTPDWDLIREVEGLDGPTEATFSADFHWLRAEGFLS